MSVRFGRYLLLWLLCLCAQAEPLRPLSRYAQPPLLSPRLWLALDTQADPITADTRPLSLLIDALASEVTSPWSAQRALPAGGVALGLLAVTPAGAEILHPAYPLDTAVTWPSQTRSRQLSLIRNTQTHPSDDQLWPLGQQQALTLRWPMPDAPVSISELSLDMPIRISPNHWPALKLQFSDGFAYDLPPPQVLSDSSGSTARLLLHNAITAWQQSGHIGQIPPWPWQILLETQVADQQGAWASWQASSPAKVNITWRDDSAQRTGREQWLRQLHSLLAGEGVQLPVNVSALELLSQQVSVSEVSCAKQAALFVTPRQPNMIANLAQWRDRQLAAAPIVASQKSRTAGADLLGLDREWSQPVAGRRTWSGGSEFHPCRTTSACELAPAPIMSNSPLPLSSWLTDSASGQPLQPLSEHWSEFAQLHPYWQSQPSPALTQFLHGISHYFDAGPSAATVTGRQGYLVHMSRDGSVQLQDGNDGRWLWAWRPAQSASLWATLTEDAALEINTADAQYTVSESDWVYWPERTTTNSDTGLDASGQRWLYGLIDRQLVTLDLTRPEFPRSGFLPLGSNAHPAQAKLWGSLSLLPLTLSSGQAQPLLLLSAADPAASTKLLILDGRSGTVLWQAGSALVSQSAGSTDADPALTQGWQAAWHTLLTADGALLAYGVDERGGVWRLRIAAKPAQVSAIQVSLNRVADFSATGTPYPYPPSLAWLRDDQGRRYPAIALAGAATLVSGVVRAASVMAFLDSKTALITESDLPLWNAGAQPPTHTMGWRRTLPTTEQIAQSPRWLDQQLLLASEVSLPTAASCPAWAWQAKIYRWPWRSGSTHAPAEASLPASASVVGDPLVSAEGELRWSGLSAIDTQATKVVVPMGYRQRVRQRQLRADD